MKRSVCFLFVLLLSLILCACETVPSVPSTSASAADAADPAPQTAAMPSPGETLSEEDRIAMWAAVVEDMSKDDLTQEQALSKAESGLSLLEACGAELLALELPEAKGSWQVQPLANSWMIVYDYLSRSIMDFESQNCNMLLEFGIARDIQVSADHVCFSIGGRGFGSQTDYYDVYYIPSDDIKRCLGSNSDLTFEERNGGWFAEAGGDNTIFYQQLGAHLYFVAEHF